MYMSLSSRIYLFAYDSSKLCTIRISFRTQHRVCRRYLGRNLTASCEQTSTTTIMTTTATITATTTERVAQFCVCMLNLSWIDVVIITSAAMYPPTLSKWRRKHTHTRTHTVKHSKPISITMGTLYDRTRFYPIRFVHLFFKSNNVSSSGHFSCPLFDYPSTLSRIYISYRPWNRRFLLEFLDHSESRFLSFLSFLFFSLFLIK